MRIANFIDIWRTLAILMLLSICGCVQSIQSLSTPDVATDVANVQGEWVVETSRMHPLTEGTTLRVSRQDVGSYTLQVIRSRVTSHWDAAAVLLDNTVFIDLVPNYEPDADRPDEALLIATHTCFVLRCKDNRLELYGFDHNRLAPMALEQGIAIEATNKHQIVFIAPSKRLQEFFKDNGISLQQREPAIVLKRPDVRVDADQPSAKAVADEPVKSGSQRSESPDIGPDNDQTINELQLEARKALQKSHDSLRWMQKFDMLVTQRYSHPELGKVVVKERLRRDAPRMVASSTIVLEDKPNFAGNLTNWSMDDGEMFISRSTSIGQKKLTGGVTVKRRNQEHWKMLEATGSFAMEGHAWGNAGKTITELLLEAKHLEVRLEKVNDQECLRITDRSEWGDMTAWIEAGPSRRLRKWESRKERGNRYADSRVGEEKNTTNSESFEQLVDNIDYESIGGRDIAVRCRVCNRINPGGGKPLEENVSEFERTDINLQPDFSTDNPFIADFDPGARVTDWDSHDRSAAFYWRDKQLKK